MEAPTDIGFSMRMTVDMEEKRKVESGRKTKFSVLSIQLPVGRAEAGGKGLRIRDRGGRILLSVRIGEIGG